MCSSDLQGGRQQLRKQLLNGFKLKGDNMSTPALGQVDEVQVIAADGTTATVKLTVIAVVGGTATQSPTPQQGATGDGAVS